MAKFIELPFGTFNKDTQSFERSMMLVNLDRVISIAPEGEMVCRVVLSGGKQITVSRRYDTLSNQITTRDDLMRVYPDEEVTAAFRAGYNKAKLEINPAKSKKKQVKQLCHIVAEWFEQNPLSTGWMAKFRGDLKEKLENLPEEETAEDEETF